MKIQRITRYSERIYDAITRLLPQLDPDCTIPDREAVKEIIRNKNEFLIVARKGRDEITGMLMLSAYQIPSGTKFWVDDVVVDSNFRGKGTGQALMKYAIEVAEKEGARYIDLTSRPFRKAANQLYINLGFKLRETNVYRFTIP